MKKIISLLLCMLVLVALAVAPVSAEYGSVSLLPDPNGKMTASGCNVSVNKDGTVTVKLTAESASVSMLYREGDTVYSEKCSEIAKYPLVAYWFGSDDGVSVSDITLHYLRKDKDAAGATLHLLGMRDNPDYLESGDEISDYGAWSIYDYLTENKGDDFVEGDYAVFTILDITYEFTGYEGDEITLYEMCTLDKVPDGFGTVTEKEEATETKASEETTEVATELVTEAATEVATEAITEVATEAEEQTTAKAEEKTETAEKQTESATEALGETSNDGTDKDDTTAGKTNGFIVLAILGAVIVVAVIAVVVMKKKKK